MYCRIAQSKAARAPNVTAALSLEASHDGPNRSCASWSLRNRCANKFDARSVAGHGTGIGNFAI